MSRSGQEALFMHPQVQPESAHNERARGAAYTFIRAVIAAVQLGKFGDVEVKRARNGDWQFTPNGTGLDIDTFLLSAGLYKFSVRSRENTPKSGRSFRQYDIYSTEQVPQLVAQFWTEGKKKIDDTRPSSNQVPTITPSRPHSRVTRIEPSHIAVTAPAYGR